jgi:hypothetical protein
MKMYTHHIKMFVINGKCVIPEKLYFADVIFYVLLSYIIHQQT